MEVDSGAVGALLLIVISASCAAVCLLLKLRGFWYYLATSVASIVLFNFVLYALDEPLDEFLPIALLVEGVYSLLVAAGLEIGVAAYRRYSSRPE